MCVRSACVVWMLFHGDRHSLSRLLCVCGRVYVRLYACTQVYKYTFAHACKRVRVWAPYILIRVCVRACILHVCVGRGLFDMRGICLCVRASGRASERV